MTLASPKAIPTPCLDIAHVYFFGTQVLCLTISSSLEKHHKVSFEADWFGVAGCQC